MEAAVSRMCEQRASTCCRTEEEETAKAICSRMGSRLFRGDCKQLIALNIIIKTSCRKFSYTPAVLPARRSPHLI